MAFRPFGTASQGFAGWLDCLCAGCCGAGLRCLLGHEMVLDDPLYAWSFGAIGAFGPFYALARAVRRGNTAGQSVLMWGSYAAMTATWFTCPCGVRRHVPASRLYRGRRGIGDLFVAAGEAVHGQQGARGSPAGAGLRRIGRKGVGPVVRRPPLWLGAMPALADSSCDRVRPPAWYRAIQAGYSRLCPVRTSSIR